MRPAPVTKYPPQHRFVSAIILFYPALKRRFVHRIVKQSWFGTYVFKSYWSG